MDTWSMSDDALGAPQPRRMPAHLFKRRIGLSFDHGLIESHSGLPRWEILDF